jgi:hypothetical protein
VVIPNEIVSLESTLETVNSLYDKTYKLNLKNADILVEYFTWYAYINLPLK